MDLRISWISIMRLTHSSPLMQQKAPARPLCFAPRYAQPGINSGIKHGFSIVHSQSPLKNLFKRSPPVPSKEPSSSFSPTQLTTLLSSFPFPPFLLGVPLPFASANPLPSSPANPSVSSPLTTSPNSVLESGCRAFSRLHSVQYVAYSSWTVGAQFFTIEDFEGVAKMERAAARFDLSREISAQRAAFCWRLSFCRRCGVPLLRIAEVTRAMWAMVARGAVEDVRAARDEARLLDREGEERLVFSPSGDLEGDKRLRVLSSF